MFLTPKEQIAIIKKGANKIVDEQDLLEKLERSYKDQRLYHGATAMEEAKSYFEAAFQRKEIPKNIPILLLEIDKERIVDIMPQLVAMGFIQSKSEFLRLIKQNGVSLNGEKIAMDDLSQVLMNGDVLQIGKKRFLQFNK